MDTEVMVELGCDERQNGCCYWKKFFTCLS